MRLTSDIVETATPAGGAGGRLGFERRTTAASAARVRAPRCEGRGRWSSCGNKTRKRSNNKHLTLKMKRNARWSSKGLSSKEKDRLKSQQQVGYPTSSSLSPLSLRTRSRRHTFARSPAFSGAAPTSSPPATLCQPTAPVRALAMKALGREFPCHPRAPGELAPYAPTPTPRPHRAWRSAPAHTRLSGGAASRLPCPLSRRILRPPHHPVLHDVAPPSPALSPRPSPTAPTPPPLSPPQLRRHVVQGQG